VSDIDINYLQDWVGKQETAEDDISLFPAKALAAALDHDVEPEKGDELPIFWEWLYFLPTPKASATGADGHPSKGGFLPPVPLPRRMWAAGSVDCHNPIIIGQPATRVSTIESVELKQGSSGTLVFVNVRHDISQSGKLCISQVQNIVYREAPTEASPLPSGKTASAEAVFTQNYKVDPVLLFRYSALTYNGHRIHYDRDYAVGEELYPALVVHGPLLVTLLLDAARQNMGSQKMTAYSFRAMRPTFDINAFSASGALVNDGSTLELWSSDHEGFTCMSIQATIEKA
jgi:3-methylfumaryl-CoA hydratase